MSDPQRFTDEHLARLAAGADDDRLMNLAAEVLELRARVSNGEAECPTTVAGYLAAHRDGPGKPWTPDELGGFGTWEETVEHVAVLAADDPEDSGEWAVLTVMAPERDRG